MANSDTGTRNTTLMVFSRLPVPGQTKTRLISVLGQQGAADLHSRLAKQTVRRARLAAAQAGCKLEIHHTGSRNEVARWLGEDLVYREQVAGDLGDRMCSALASAAGPGLIVGTDCPGLTDRIMLQAWQSLAEHDVVLGPARDGGYYLIGMKQVYPHLFASITWGTGDVLLSTLERAGDLGLRVGQLETLSDVDRPEDLGEIPDFYLKSAKGET